MTCLMALVLCVPCDACKGSRCAGREKILWTGQDVSLGRWLRKPAENSRPRFYSTQKQAAASRARLDTRHQNRNAPRSPDFRHKESRKALWLNKPAGRYARLCILHERTDNAASAASLPAHYAGQLVGSPSHENHFTPEFVKKLCKQGQVKVAVDVLEVLVGGTTNPGIDKHLFYHVLKECMVQTDLTLGEQVHALAVKMGLGSDTFLCAHLIRMYAAHGKLREAMDVFRGVALPNAFMWSSIISAHAKQGQAQRAIELYQLMRAMRIMPDNHVFVAALQACTAAGDLRSGKQLHSDIAEHTVEPNVVVGSSLVNMYAKCGGLSDARIVFDGLREKNVVTWNSMISGYAQQEGMGQDALSLYSAMRDEGMVVPDAVTYVCLLQACASMGVSALEKGKQVHSEIKERGVQSELAVGGSLVNMYAKCGSLRDARIVFDGLHEKNVVIWNTMIAGYAQQAGTGQEALNIYSAMRNEGMVFPDRVTFMCILQACANMGVSALEEGKQVHSQIKERGVQSDVAVGCSLVNMYAKCGSLSDARIVFDGLHEKNVVTWNSMISGYAQQEDMGQEALNIYSAMRNEGMVVPDAVTFVSLLQACANMGLPALGKGRQLHTELKELGVQSDVAVGGGLVNMYAKCGSLRDARIVFDALPEKNVVTWSVMTAGYAQQGMLMGKEALSLYNAMRNEGMVSPNAVTFVCLLQACASMGVSALEEGKQLHSKIKECGVQSDIVVGTSLVNMYAKCGSLTDARVVFEGLREKNVVTWNTMISGYAQKEGMSQDALNIYSAMRNEGMVVPNAVTYVCLLQACANMGVAGLEEGKQLHSEIKDRGVQSGVVLGTSLVNMYAKCGSLTDARLVFDGLCEKNVVTWNTMISGYAQQKGMGQEALNVYSAMRKESMAVADPVTFVCLLQACANLGVPALDKGKQLHSQVKECCVESDVAVGNSLVNMYVKCGSLRDARIVFDGLCEKNVVTWSAMIAGYAQQEGMGQDALSLYSAMRKEGMVVSDAVTFVCLLQACANMSVSALEDGKQLHTQMKERGVETDVAVGGSLVNMYAKCGSLRDARIVFDGLLEKNVVTWNAMIAGYAQQEGMSQDALSLYSAMRNEGMVVPDTVTFVCLLQACANTGISALEKGRQVHSEITERGIQSDVAVGGSLVNMYAKCGSLRDARIVFDGLHEKNVVTWSAMIAGYAQQEGMGQDALTLYSVMRDEGVVPNIVTYACLLQACASVAALQQGKELHSEIREEGLESDALIGTSLVNMYAQCGRLEISRQVFDRLPMKRVELWNALINGYAEHGEGRMAIQCFEELLEQGVQPDDVTYICLLKACSRAGLVDEGQRYFNAMEERQGVKPDERHYSCMVDLLGRSGHLGRAEQMLLGAPCLAGSVVSWTALLSACKSYGDTDRGLRCFEHIVNLEPAVATAYVLLGSIYANAGRWEEVEKVEMLRKAAGAKKKAAVACIEVKKEVHEFVVGEERCDIAGTLRKMNTRVKEGGHVPQTQLVLRAHVSEQEKEEALCGHAEKLALAYGLLNTPGGSALLVTKNLRMCNDCHSSTKIMSRVEKRDIVVRDGNRVHRFQNGACSCQDKA